LCISQPGLSPSLIDPPADRFIAQLELADCTGYHMLK
jgi:hypothetical protein